MRPRHWWGAAAGAGVVAGAAFLAPVALAAPAAPSGATAARAVAAKPPSKPQGTSQSRSQSRPVVKSGRATAKGQPGRNDRGRDDKGRNDHGRDDHHHHHHHPYPPNATPSVSITGPSQVRPGRAATFTVKVSINSTTVVGASAALYASAHGTNWKQVAQTKTADDGTARFSYTASRGVMLRVVVAGGRGYSASQSDVLTLVKR